MTGGLMVRGSLDNKLSWRSHSGALAKDGGGDFRKLEPVYATRSWSFSRIDKIIRRLRLFYKENPASFDVPAFAQKVY